MMLSLQLELSTATEPSPTPPPGTVPTTVPYYRFHDRRSRLSCDFFTSRLTSIAAMLHSFVLMKGLRELLILFSLTIALGLSLSACRKARCQGGRVLVGDLCVFENAAPCDEDGDGFVSDAAECDASASSGEARDCDDQDPKRHPFVVPICGDGKDRSCAGVSNPLFMQIKVSTGAQEVGRVEPFFVDQFDVSDTNHQVSLLMPAPRQEQGIGKWGVLYTSLDDAWVRRVSVDDKTPSLGALTRLAIEVTGWPFDGAIAGAAALRPVFGPGAVPSGSIESFAVVGSVEGGTHVAGFFGDADSSETSLSYSSAAGATLGRPLGVGLTLGITVRTLNGIGGGDDGVIYFDPFGNLKVIAGVTVPVGEEVDLRAGHIRSVIGYDGASEFTLIGVDGNHSGSIANSHSAAATLTLANGVDADDLAFVPSGDEIDVYQTDCDSEETCGQICDGVESCEDAIHTTHSREIDTMRFRAAALSSGGVLAFENFGFASSERVDARAFDAGASSMTEGTALLRAEDVGENIADILDLDVGSHEIIDQGQEVAIAVVLEREGASAPEIWVTGIRACDEK